MSAACAHGKVPQGNLDGNEAIIVLLIWRMAILLQPRAFPQSSTRRRGPARVPRRGDAMAAYVEGPVYLGIDFGTSGARAR